jgi:hypothetical protein
MKKSNVRQNMAVQGSCGTFVGKVDAIEGRVLKLTIDSPDAHGRHHYVPLAWVARVGAHVHLDRPASEVCREWTDEGNRPGRHTLNLDQAQSEDSWRDEGG